MQDHIRSEIKQIGDVSLIIVDSSAAYFEGDEENDNKQNGDHARRLRALTAMPGEPCVIAACHPVKNASDDKLRQIAADPGGAKLMFRIVNTMQGLTTSEAEKAQLYRAMTAITRARGGTPMAVEVITFRSGFKPLDALGEWWFDKGAKGHTAVIVADLVYSFDERGWVMEGSKAEYMGRNTHRDAIGQVLKVPPDDALAIQDGLNKSIGHGVYFFSGLVCTDASAKSLVKVLGEIDAKSNPQKFADMLAASGHVETTNTYAKKP